METYSRGNPTLSYAEDVRRCTQECRICGMTQPELYRAYGKNCPILTECVVCHQDACVPGCADYCKAGGCDNAVCLHCQARLPETMINGKCEDHSGDEE